MKKFSLLVLMIVLSSCGTKEEHLTFQQTLEKIVQTEGEHGRFSGTALVARNDSILMIKSAGYANEEQAILNDSTTRFRIASTGKFLTQLVILQLVQEQRLRLEDTIGKFFPGFDQPNASKITIFHLLSHRSGLGDVYTSDEYEKPENYTTPENVLRIIAKETPAFVPGTDEQYSNSGYYLLGMIISKATGKPFAKNIEERIFTPLGMTSSGFAETGAVAGRTALGYKKTWFGSNRHDADPPGEASAGTGGEYSTAKDLYKVFRSIISDNILLRDSTKGLLFNHFEPASWQTIMRSKKILGFVGGDTRGWSAKLTFLFTGNAIYGSAIIANFDNMAHELDLKLRKAIEEHERQ